MRMLVIPSTTLGRFVFLPRRTVFGPEGSLNSMIDYVRQRAIEVLRSVTTAVLATHGPAGILASRQLCEAVGLHLYLLLPQTSDHLFNLEEDGHVALVTDEWDLRGLGHALSPEGLPPGLEHLKEYVKEWHVLVKVLPTQIQVRRREGWGPIETIDLPALE